MSFDAERLYELLPTVYRVRDAEGAGGAKDELRQLLDVIAGEIAVLDEDLEQLYDDQFIETCAEWVAPYIGDLLGYRTLHGLTAGGRQPARRGREHDRLPPAQGHRGDARAARTRRDRAGTRVPSSSSSCWRRPST